MVNSKNDTKRVLQMVTKQRMFILRESYTFVFSSTSGKVNQGEIFALRPRKLDVHKVTCDILSSCLDGILLCMCNVTHKVLPS
jgi:hypothetical protein